MTVHSKLPTTPEASTVTPPLKGTAPPVDPTLLLTPLLSLAVLELKVSVLQVPSTRVVNVYCGLVALCSLWNAMSDDTAISPDSGSGTEAIGNSHENFSLGPS